jgi:hypothetical protein
VPLVELLRHGTGSVALASGVGSCCAILVLSCFVACYKTHDFWMFRKNVTGGCCKVGLDVALSMFHVFNLDVAVLLRCLHVDFECFSQHESDVTVGFSING